MCAFIQQLVASGKLELLQEMYREWPFFQVTLDMVEMVFAKADPRVSLLYEEHLVSKDLVPFGDLLRRYVIKCTFCHASKSEMADTHCSGAARLRRQSISCWQWRGIRRCCRILQRVFCRLSSPLGHRTSPRLTSCR